VALPELLNTSRLLGGALGLAVLGTLAASHTALAFFVGALLCLAGALVAAALLRPQRQLAVVEAPEAEAETEPIAA
jgi:uncharacterized membrane protein HdeD (DUF308 family)